MENRDHRISLEEARAITGLRLSSARDAVSGAGVSYHELEIRTEGAAHKTARADAIRWFVSRGYHVFPEGVGVDGVFTFADFLAIQVETRRVVFVEILSDAGITPQTLARKRALQLHGGLCFIVFSGKKAFNRDAAETLKREIEAFADVLVYNLDAYAGNYITNDSRATVSFDTTRDLGIRIEVAIEDEKKATFVSVRFLTRLYQNPEGVPCEVVPEDDGFFEEQFHRAFQILCRQFGARVKETRARAYITNFNAMRRKAGLKAFDGDGQLFAVLRSERRDTQQTTESPATNLYGCYEFPNRSTDIVDALLAVYRGLGCNIEHRRCGANAKNG